MRARKGLSLFENMTCPMYHHDTILWCLSRRCAPALKTIIDYFPVNTLRGSSFGSGSGSISGWALEAQ